uniref:Uncharacterized protein n=1 Tax=Romanomermis culicivorax TaxID=13658 RepID=A0A915KU60_ROMCU
MGSIRSTFQYFSLNTSLHGFRRLWLKNRWRKCWAMLITLAIVLCIYQIVDKLGVLMKDPLTININLSYEDKMEFPVITICNTLKVR